MTGTACDLCEYDEKETSCLSNFDLFSQWLFEKINNDRLQLEDSSGCESIFNGNDSIRPEVLFNDGGLKG